MIDTSSLFELKRFSPEVFPSLWASLDPLVATGRLIAPREVLREVERGDDEMNSWAKAHHAMFLDLDPATAACVEEVLERFEPLRDTTRFGPVFADPLVVGLCLARSRADRDNSHLVVTEERLRGSGALKIPNLCQPFGLTAIPIMEMCRREGFRF